MKILRIWVEGSAGSNAIFVFFGILVRFSPIPNIYVEQILISILTLYQKRKKILHIYIYILILIPK